MKYKPTPVKSFVYRGILWESGKKYRNSLFVFRKKYDNLKEKFVIEYAVEYVEPYVPYRTLRTNWVDFCNLDSAKDISE